MSVGKYNLLSKINRFEFPPEGEKVSAPLSKGCPITAGPTKGKGKVNTEQPGRERERMNSEHCIRKLEIE